MKTNKHVIHSVVARKLFHRIHLGYLIPFLMLFAFGVSSTKAQGSTFWAVQERIPETFDYTEEPPFLIADLNHTVHAFNSQPLDLLNPDSQRAVFYRRWTIESGWTFPNDILFDADGTIFLLGAVGDQAGKAHLALLYDQGLYYSQAFLSRAGDSSAWSTPLFLGTNVRNPTTGFERVGSITADASGTNIAIIYSGSENGSGLYSVHSSDGGNNWTHPYPIFLASDNTLAISDPKAYSGESGMIHAVWGTRNKEGHGELGFYANFNHEDNIWSEPIELDTSGLGAPSVIEHDGKIFVTYILNKVNANLWRLSNDGGKTWTNPGRLSPPHVGSNGLVSFIVDSSNTLHAFFGQRIDDNNHGMWHTTWTGYGWTTAEAVVRGKKITDVIGGRGFDPNAARAVIVNGNVAVVAWGTDGSSGTNGAWYSYKRFDVPELPSQPLPTPPPTAEQIKTDSMPFATEILLPESSSTSIPQNILNAPRSTGNPQIGILIGVFPVLVFVIVMLVLRFIHVRNK